MKTITAAEYQKKVKKRKFPEDDLSIECNQECVRLSKRHIFDWFHVPNGGYRNKLEAIRFKRMGVRPGVYDYCILRPHKSPGWIELKIKPNRPSADQKKFGVKMDEFGSPNYIVYNLEEFRSALISMLT
jgi:hypothetical protein